VEKSKQFLLNLPAALDWLAGWLAGSLPHYRLAL